MSEQSSDHKTDALAAHGGATAALPLVEAPAMSPASGETVSSAGAAPADIFPDPTNATRSILKSSATQRFRAAAAAQIAPARERLERRNSSSTMAIVLMASLAGGFGTVLATSAIAHFAEPADQRAAHTREFAVSMMRLEDDILALRSKIERTADLTAAQAAKAGARFEAIEKAQAEPLSKLGKLAEAVEKLRAANAALATQSASAASGDITGSIKPATPGVKPPSGKPSIVDGWTLLEVDRDAALIEGQRGLFETYVGDTIPGVGRVEAFRKQDGRWVIVTAKGLIVSR